MISMHDYSKKKVYHIEYGWLLQSQLKLYTLVTVSLAEWSESPFPVTQNLCVKGSIRVPFDFLLS